MEVMDQTLTDPRLTQREWEVLALVLAGETDKQIAHELGISPRTASNHVASILRKLDVETRSGARRWAVSNGMAGVQSAVTPSLPIGADCGASPI